MAVHRVRAGRRAPTSLGSMFLRRLRISTRLLLGGLAAILGIGTVSAEAMAASAEPAGDGHTTAIDPTSMGTESTLESCTAMFGLYKANSDLASFDLVQTGLDPITPAPVIGTDLVPVITVSDGVTTHECTAVPGWTDAASFTADYTGPDEFIVNGSMPYPGTGFYLLPGLDGEALMYHGATPFAPTTRTLRFVGALPDGHTLSWSPVEPLELQSSLRPIISMPTVADLSTPFFARVFAAVQATGDLAQRDYLYASLLADYTPTAPYCSDSSPTLTALVATMTELLGTFNFTVNGCVDLSNGALSIGRIQLFDAEVDETGILVTIAGPVAPAFTG